METLLTHEHVILYNFSNSRQQEDADGEQCLYKKLLHPELSSMSATK